MKTGIDPQYADEPGSGEYDTIADRASALRDRLSEVGLNNTDEDRILRERFRHNDEYESLPEWPVEEFLDALEEFLDEYTDEATEFQDTLVSESEVEARLICWGVVGS